MDAQILELFPGSATREIPPPTTDNEKKWQARCAALEVEVQSLRGTLEVIEGVCDRRRRSLHPSSYVEEG